MIEVITKDNIRKYEGYLTTLRLSDDMRYLGMEYGGEAVGSCSLISSGFTLFIDELHLDACFQEQIIEELMRYLCYYAWNQALQIIEIYTADEKEKKIFQKYGIRFDTATVAYQCSLDELLKKSKVNELLKLADCHFQNTTLYNLEHSHAKRIDGNLKWIYNDSEVWKQASYLMMNKDTISGMCVVERNIIEDKTYYRLAYLYAKNPINMAVVMSASLKAILRETKNSEPVDKEPCDIQFTFAAVNIKSIALAKGFGFEEAEIRNICERGRVLLYELMYEINQKKEMI